MQFTITCHECGTETQAKDPVDLTENQGWLYVEGESLIPEDCRCPDCKYLNR